VVIRAITGAFVGAMGGYATFLAALLLAWSYCGWSGGGFGVVLVPIMAFGLAWAMVVRRSNEEGAR
jgi:hypothetical protein